MNTVHDLIQENGGIEKLPAVSPLQVQLGPDRFLKLEYSASVPVGSRLSVYLFSRLKMESVLKAGFYWRKPGWACSRSIYEPGKEKSFKSIVSAIAAGFEKFGGIFALLSFALSMSGTCRLICCSPAGRLSNHDRPCCPVRSNGTTRQNTFYPRISARPCHLPLCRAGCHPSIARPRVARAPCRLVFRRRQHRTARRPIPAGLRA